MSNICEINITIIIHHTAKMSNYFNNHKFSSSNKIPIIFKICIGIVNIISKRLTLQIVIQIFSTPKKFNIPKRELGMLESAQKKKMYCKKTDQNIEVLSYGFSDKKILLAHGWSGRSTQLFMIANHLLEQGYMIISFDAPAHGASSGKRTNLIELIAAVKSIVEEFGPFVGGVGHSFGGLILMNLQAEQKTFKCLVTIGAPDKVKNIFANFIKNIGLPPKFYKKLIRYFEKKYNLTVAEKSGSYVAKKIDIPTLVIHDALDGDVTVNDALHIRKHLRKGVLLISNGFGHTKILRNKEIIKKIITFIIKNT